MTKEMGEPEEKQIKEKKKKFIQQTEIYKKGDTGFRKHKLYNTSFKTRLLN